MNTIKSCAGCVWSEQCSEKRICENYDPIDPEEKELKEIEEYEADLRMRDKYYQRKVVRQGD